jgi:hypothetical protein
MRRLFKTLQTNNFNIEKNKQKAQHGILLCWLKNMSLMFQTCFFFLPGALEGPALIFYFYQTLRHVPAYSRGCTWETRIEPKSEAAVFQMHLPIATLLKSDQ